MLVKKKPFTRYAVLSLLMFICVILGLGKVLVDETNDHLAETHFRMFPETVRTLLDQHQDAAHWFSQPPGKTLPEPVAKLSKSLLNIPGVFRLKVWNTDGTILWSDNTELIGKNFAQNHHFQVASSGKAAYNNKGLQKPENQTEKDERIVVEVYAPVYDGNRIIGVMELYESDKVLSSLMVRSTEIIWISLAVAGVALYLLMLVAFLLSQDVITQFSQTKMKN
jgi:hypothetical protein